MKKLSKLIVKGRYILLGIFISLTVLSLISVFFLNINSDLISYLPDDMTTSQGYKELQEAFNMEGDAIIAVEGASMEEMTAIANRIQALDGAREGGVMWYGTLDSFGGGMSGGMFGDLIEEIKNNEDVKKLFMPKDGIYTIMIQMSVPVSSNEAGALIKDAKAILNEYDCGYAFGGSSAISTQLLDSALGELSLFLILAVLVVVIILLLTTKSILEPLVLMITLGISILLNMGTNIIFPQVSIITFATSAILQLALSMDYSIFLLHSYADERKRTLSSKIAMQRALPKTFSTVCSSSLTTVGGFLALTVMHYQIGLDMGLVLAKGVLLSLFSVLFLQPCLMLIFDKWIDATSHKLYVPKFNGSAKVIVKGSKVFVVLCLALVAPAIILGNSITYTYMQMDKNAVEDTELQQTVNLMGNSLMLCVPTVNSRTHVQYIDELKDIEGVELVNSIYSMAIDKANLIEVAIRMKVPELSNYVNFEKGKVLYMVMVNVESEDPRADGILQDIRKATTNAFGADTFDTKTPDAARSTITGMTQAVNDLSKITPQDFKLVSIMSVLIILFVLIFTIKSFKFSIALVGLVELGIFVNLAVCFLMGEAVNFMSYLIISSVQLGATIDYAILYAVNYIRNLKTMSKKTATYNAIKQSALPIITSASIIAGVCLTVNAIASNYIIAQVTNLIGRGAIISAVFVLFVLPGLLMIITKKNQKFIKFDLSKLPFMKKRMEHEPPMYEYTALQHLDVSGTPAEIQTDIMQTDKTK